MRDTNIQNKKNLTFLLAILIVFSVSFLYFKFVFKKPVSLVNLAPGLNVSAIDEKAEQKKQEQAIIGKTASLISAKDPAQCESVNKTVNGINYKTICLNNIYYHLAADNADFSVCEKIVDVSLETCQKTVISLLLTKEKKLTVCDKVPEKLRLLCADTYWGFVALDQKDPVLCAKTSSADLNLACQNNILLTLANQKESLACSSFADNQIKADCENYLKGKESCASIKNSLLQSICSGNK